MSNQLYRFVYIGEDKRVPRLVNGNRYLILGFLGMDDIIVFVADDNTVREVIYDEDEWKEW